jgi:periplasmic mercuric ion binding protein
MKSRIFIPIIFLFASFSTFAQSKVVNSTIKVYGNCIMCKKRIEAALDNPGIKKAEWSIKTKELSIVYNSKKISEKQIHEIVAKAGHDTDKVKAKDETYASLPFCCLYRDHEMEGHH